MRLARSCLAGLAGLLALAFATAGLAQTGAEMVPAADAKLELVVEGPADPFEQEMLILSVRGQYLFSLNIALETLEQPVLAGLNWMQLGRDRWNRAMVEGRLMRTFERRLAIFPQSPGRLTIPPFTHVLTLATSDGRRLRHAVRSPEIAVGVRARPAEATARGAGAWWLPARAIRVSDSWDRPPERLGPADVARRTVILEAEGIAPQSLPPAPAVAGSGIILFTDPEERTSLLTPDGPVSRVTWSWTVRPQSSAGGELRETAIPWFDTRARQMREIVLAAQPIGLAAAANERRRPSEVGATLPAGPIGIGLGLAFGLALMLPGRRLRAWSDIRRRARGFFPRPEARALRRAARSGNGLAVREAARQLIGQSGGHRATALAQDLLSRLDRHLFAPEATRTSMNLQDFARSFLRAFARRGAKVGGS